MYPYLVSESQTPRPRHNQDTDGALTYRRPGHSWPHPYQQLAISPNLPAG